MTKWIHFSFCLVLLVGCSQNRVPPLAENATILAFGDSLTAGFGATPREAYPSVFASLANRKVINAGVSGETTSQGLLRFNAALDHFQPQFVILLEGGNDILRNVSATTTKSNLSSMISDAQEQNIPVLLIGVPRKSLFSDSADFYRELAKEHDVLFMDDMLSDLLRSPELKSDAVHLNAEGYRQMAVSIFEFLQEQHVL